jgi:hypothetical protein
MPGIVHLVSEMPIVCTLNAADQAVRFDEWRQLKQLASARELTDAGACLTFAPDAVVASSLVDLAAREVACCAFLTFTMTLGADRLVLAVSGPSDAKEILAALVS